MIYEIKDWKYFITKVRQRREEYEGRKRHPRETGVQGIETQGAVLTPRLFALGKLD
jgi:hypothetical protein